MNMVFNTKPLLKVLTFSLVIIITLNLLAIFFYFNGMLDSSIGQKIFKKLYVDNESNLPSFFNTLLFLISALLLYYVYFVNKKANKSKSYYWFCLMSIFLFLSLDESASVHEFFVTFLPKHGIGGKGFFVNAWVIPYGLGLVAFLVFFLDFLRNLTSKIRFGFILSGLIYVTGAIGCEMLGSKIMSTIGTDTLIYAMETTVEETLEMTGLILFIFYIIKYIRIELNQYVIKVV